MGSDRAICRLTRDTEIRKLSAYARFHLVDKLDRSSAWKDVMALVRKVSTDSSACHDKKYKAVHVKMVEDAGTRLGRSCAEIFLDEWGCSGNEFGKLPTLDDLLSLLIEAQLYMVADYVAVDLLGEARPSRPSTGPAALVSIPPELLPQIEHVPPTAPAELNPVPECSEELTEHAPYQSELGDVKESTSSRIAQQETVQIEDIAVSYLQHISFDILKKNTNNFNRDPVGENDGRLLGQGAFGSVHLAIQNHQSMAVKLLDKNELNVEKMLKDEVATVHRIQHPNLLRFLAYSSDGPQSCLVYEYMTGGDLEKRLACQGKWKSPLPYFVRIKIAHGTSQGISHLHNYFDRPIVHRDVKSANILLDENLNPKLGDFGLIRTLNDNSSGQLTSTILGTSVYMSMEAIMGEVSIENDVFSFGVVLLELLTGLSPYNANGQEDDLISYKNEVCENSIQNLLDSKAGNWLSKSGEDLSERIFSLAENCLDDKVRRPSMSSVVEILQSILDQSSPIL